MRIAYFSMEIALEAALPTYAGGLGVLAGDTLRAAADLDVPMIGVSLVHRRGYFRQRLTRDGWQQEEPDGWDPAERLERAPGQVEIAIEGRPVRVAAWRYQVRGVTGATVPVYLLDTDLPDNDASDRALTHYLYGGDARYRLAQEMVLGLGGLALLEALGHDDVSAFHMNEGHSALLAVGHYAAARRAGQGPDEARLATRRRCVFTTHTPVPAGHDQFPSDLAHRLLGAELSGAAHDAGCWSNGTLNMTHVGLTLAGYVNGVAMRHGEISRGMFPTYPIQSITNGVHGCTWVAPPQAALYDRHLAGWRRDSNILRYAVSIGRHEIRAAHDEAKGALLAEVERRTGAQLSPRALTIGFARRATPYKRADLLFHDLERLRGIARRVGPLQIVYAGKAHPRDEAGKHLIQRVFAAGAALAPHVPVVYLEDYDLDLGRLMCAGVDLWLNTPLKPHEASGTSGMKAALNGVPSLSVLDGWWIEGHIEGVTGWSIGDDWAPGADPAREAASLYDKLEWLISPMFHGQPKAWAGVMRSAIALNGSFFEAQRMVLQYLRNAYGGFGSNGHSDAAAPSG